MPWHRWPDVVSAVLAVAALLLWVLPVRVATSPNARADDAGPNSATASATKPGGESAGSIAGATASVSGAASLSAGPTDTLAPVIVNGNLFSASRRAPTTRFVVPGRADATDNALNGAAMTNAAAAASMTDSIAGGNADGTSYPRLSGIVTMNGERRALLQLSSGDGVASLYRVGDVHAGFRVLDIGGDVVVLTSKAGTTRLRLTARRMQDSLEVSRE